MHDYWDAVRNPGLAVSKHKKHNLHGTLKLLLISAFFLSLGASVFVSKLALQTGNFSTNVFAGLFLMTFSIIVLLALGFGLIHEYVSAILGSHGKFYESLTAVSFFFVPLSAGIFVASLLLFVPYLGVVLGSFIAALMFAMGLASLYRATKELSKVDAVTSHIVVFVLIVSFFVMLYAAFLFNAAAFVR